MSLGAPNRDVAGLEFAVAKRDYLSADFSSKRLLSLGASKSSNLLTGGLMNESLLGFDVLAVLTSPDGTAGISAALKMDLNETSFVKVGSVEGIC